jgi:Flp pilus assembly protein CpaB
MEAQVRLLGEREKSTAMKKNWVPLLGIAFIVAIISTGVFYGLFAGKLRSSSELPGHAIVVAAHDLDRGTVIQASDLRVSEVEGALAGGYSKPEDAAGGTLLVSMKTNEPLLEERITPPPSKASRANEPVPDGMRAVTMHIFQSESLLSMLRPGSRVDLQAVAERNGGTELRTVLENVQVLAVSAPDANGNRPPGAAVTILIGAQDADMVALADAGSHIRLTLRNPADDETTPQHSLTLAALFSGAGKVDKGPTETTHSARSAVWDHPVQLHVRVLDVSDSAWEQLHSASREGAPNGAWRVAAFASSDEAAKTLRILEQKGELETVSGERLTAGVGRPITFHTGAKADRLRVEFAPQDIGKGKFALQMKPAFGSSAGPGIQIADTGSFLLEDQSTGPDANLASRLYPGRAWDHRHLVILVSAHAIGGASTVALAGGDRGR